MSEFKVGDFVKIPDDFDIEYNRSEYPEFTHSMDVFVGQYFYIKIPTSPKNRVVLRIENFSTELDSPLAKDYLFSIDWLEKASLGEHLKSGDKIVLRDKDAYHFFTSLNNVKETYPFVSDEMMKYGHSFLSKKELEVEDLHRLEKDGHYYYALKIKGISFLWHPILFKKVVERERRLRPFEENGRGGVPYVSF